MIICRRKRIKEKMEAIYRCSKFKWITVAMFVRDNINHNNHIYIKSNQSNILMLRSSLKKLQVSNCKRTSTWFETNRNISMQFLFSDEEFILLSPITWIPHNFLPLFGLWSIFVRFYFYVCPLVSLKFGFTNILYICPSILFHKSSHSLLLLCLLLLLLL